MKYLYLAFFQLLFLCKWNAQQLNLSVSGPMYTEAPYEYVIPTIVMTTGNVFVNAFNIHNLNNGNRRKSNAGFGVITGVIQVAMAATQHDPQKKLYPTLMAIDVTVGIVTIATSTIRMCVKSRPEPAKTAFNMHYLPSQGAFGPSLSLHVARTF